DPLLRRMMGSVRGTRSVVGKPRFLGSHRMQELNPGDGVVSHVLVEEIVWLVVRGLNRLDVLEESRRPLTGIAPKEPVEVFKAEPRRPKVEGSGLAAVPVGHVVVLAIPRGAVAVLLEHLREGPGALWHERVVAREAGGEFHDDARRSGMMVAARKQRRTGR